MEKETASVGPWNFIAGPIWVYYRTSPLCRRGRLHQRAIDLLGTCLGRVVSKSKTARYSARGEWHPALDARVQPPEQSSGLVIGRVKSLSFRGQGSPCDGGSGKKSLARLRQRGALARFRSLRWPGWMPFSRLLDNVGKKAKRICLKSGVLEVHGI